MSFQTSSRHFKHRHAMGWSRQVLWDFVITVSVRVLIVAAFTTMCLRRNHADAFVQNAWDDLRVRWWFQHDTFEPVLATTSFAFWMALWYAVDLVAYAHIPTRYRLQTSESMHQWKPQGHVAQEVLLYLAPLAMYDHVKPRRVLPPDAPTALACLAQVMCSLLLYDCLFAIFHRAMHSHPVLYRRVHAKHHHNAVVRARDAVRVSALEQLVDVSCSILALKLTGSHPLSRAIHNIVITFLITELHSGYSFPWSFESVVPYGLYLGPTKHVLHHSVNAPYYAKVFAVLECMPSMDVLRVCKHTSRGWSARRA
uniref:Fatty acid hydroxylase domain-containing protein n=1 Tax=Pycnococcus provasolii TaxID=41880 RepID=A0A7R9SWM1_9CHLO